MKESQVENEIKRQAAPLSLLPALVLHTMTLITFMLSFLPKTVQSYVSTMMIGGLFGLMIPPFFLWHYCLQKLIWDDQWTNSIYMLLLIGYYVSVYFENKYLFSRRNKNRGCLRSPTNWIEKRSVSFWSTHLDYFPFQLTIKDKNNHDKTKEETEKSNAQYIFAVHPHGIHCWPLNLFSMFGSPLDTSISSSFNNIVSGKRTTQLCANVLFWIPVVRELFYVSGYVPAARPIAQSIMELSHKSIVVCTGGEEESMHTTVGKDIYVLKNRKGFVRLALQYGASLVPVIGLENNDMFSTYPTILTNLRFWILKTMGLALPIFHGLYVITPLPYRQRLNIVIGEPIHISPEHLCPRDKYDKPPSDIVDIYHSKYIDAVKQLHKQHAKNGRSLEII